MFVVEYKAKFVRLSQYTTEIVSIERDCCKRFRFGLHCNMQLYLGHDTANFDELVDKAKAIEEIRIVALRTIMRSRKQMFRLSGRMSKRDCESRNYGRNAIRNFQSEQLRPQNNIVAGTRGSHRSPSWPLYEHYKHRHPG